MRALSLCGFCLMVMLGSASAWAQEEEGGGLEAEKHELQLQAHRSELEHQQAMREIELDERRQEVQHRGHRGGIPKTCRFILILCAIVHLLLTIWVYQDMRERDASNGLWLAIVLLTGLLGTAVYALVRIGDISAATKGKT